MSADNANINTAAAAWAWLTHQLASYDDIGRGSVSREWSDFRKEHHGKPVSYVNAIHWPSDYWIAKTQHALEPVLGPVWAIPERLDQWPTLNFQDRFLNTTLNTTYTNSVSLLNVLAAADPIHVLSATDAIRRFHNLASFGYTHGDQAMISANQLRAWLTTAFGFLIGISLAPNDDHESHGLLVQQVETRLSGFDEFSTQGSVHSNLADYGCDYFYNTRLTRDGRQTLHARQGQGADWQHDWQWLSRPQDASAAKATLQLGGLLLTNEALLSGLIATIQHGDTGSRRRALCVIRRWLLTTKTLAWTFEALQHNWTTVRPQDLLCFAFAALSPTWPRRAVSISHRSGDAKPVLATLRMWNSPHAAIDASYVPAWETNTGMIWSLFASVPLVARVQSDLYHDSEWCRREHEMLQYLVEHSDFLEGRAMVDIAVDQLPQLDGLLFEDGAAGGSDSTTKSLSTSNKDFPPFTLVLVGSVSQRIELALLRAAGALRLINILVRDPQLANEVARQVAAGRDLPIEAPTNNPLGWAAYGDIFRDLESLLESEPRDSSPLRDEPRRSREPSLSLKIPDHYSALDVERDAEAAAQIPDLSDGLHHLRDILSALEWQRTVFHWFMDEGYGDKIMVDLRASTEGDWTTHPQMSVARGLLAFAATPTPIWIMQRPGQNAHLWWGFREQPIFTHHVAEQFGWLKPVLLDPRWLAYYLVNAGLHMEPNLETAVLVAVRREVGPEALKVDRQGEHVVLAVPEPRMFFVVPSDALQDCADLFDASTEPPSE